MDRHLWLGELGSNVSTVAVADLVSDMALLPLLNEALLAELTEPEIAQLGQESEAGLACP